MVDIEQTSGSIKDMHLVMDDMKIQEDTSSSPPCEEMKIMQRAVEAGERMEMEDDLKSNLNVNVNSNSNTKYPMEEMLHDCENTIGTVIDSSISTFREQIQGAMSAMMKNLLVTNPSENLHLDRFHTYLSEKNMHNGKGSSSEKEKQLKECVMTLIAENNTLTEELKGQQSLILQLQRDLVREKIARSELNKVVHDETRHPLRSLPKLPSSQKLEHELWQEGSSVNFGFFNKENENIKKKEHVPVKPVEMELGLMGMEDDNMVVKVQDPIASPSLSGFRNSFMDQLLPSSLLLDSPSRLQYGGAEPINIPDSIQETTQVLCQSCSAQTLDVISSPADVQCLPCNHVLCQKCVDDEMKSVSLSDAMILMNCSFCEAAVADIKLLHEHLTSPHPSPLSVLSGRSPSSSAQSLFANGENTPHLSDIETVLDRFDGDIQKSIDYLLAEYAHAQTSTLENNNGCVNGMNMNGMSRIVTPACGPAGGPSLSNWKTEVCIYYLQGKCNKNKRTCSFAHGESDLVKTLNGNNTGLASSACKRSGSADLLRSPMAQCLNGTNGPNGVAPRSQNYKTELCYYFLKGCCNYSMEECRFAHGQIDLRKSMEGSTASSPANSFEFATMDLNARNNSYPSINGSHMEESHQCQLHNGYPPMHLPSLHAPTMSPNAPVWPAMGTSSSRTAFP